MQLTAAYNFYVARLYDFEQATQLFSLLKNFSNKASHTRTAWRGQILCMR